MLADIQTVQISMMIPADCAQAVGGKLYILGGGFNHLAVPEFPAAHTFDVALIVDVPWDNTNRPYDVAIELVDADGQSLGYRAEATLETGRPAGARPGTSFALPLAIPVSVEFPVPGRYAIRGEVNGVEVRRAVLDVVSTAAVGL